MRKGSFAKRVPHKTMRIKQLSEEAGVPKGTIQFYVKEGLIPKPIKTHSNMAYYDRSHLEAIKLVKELQSKRFLPLSVIKQVVRGRGGDLSVDEIRTLIEIDGKLFQNLDKNPTVKPLTASELSERTQIPLKEIRVMEQLSFLHPVKRGKRKLYEEDDIRMVECWGKITGTGYFKGLKVDIKSMKFLRDFLELIVEEEAKLLASRVEKNISSERLVRMVEEGTPILNTMIGLLHKQLIRETLSRYATEIMKQNERNHVSDSHK